MSVHTTKRVAARILKCGESRVKILDSKKAAEALTHDDIVLLIKQRVIVKRQSTGVGRGKARFKQARKNAGRRRGRGSKKGAKYSLVPRKERWIKKVRSQRALLTRLKPKMVEGSYASVYRMIKGSNFRDKKHLLLYVNENKLMKQGE